MKGKPPRLYNKILDEEIIKAEGKYVRLLPFTSDQINEFFDRYRVMVEDKLLTYKDTQTLDLPVEEMTKPLFAWIFSFVEVNEKIQSKSELE